MRKEKKKSSKILSSLKGTIMNIIEQLAKEDIAFYYRGDGDDK